MKPISNDDDTDGVTYEPLDDYNPYADDDAPVYVPRATTRTVARSTTSRVTRPPQEPAHVQQRIPQATPAKSTPAHKATPSAKSTPTHRDRTAKSGHRHFLLRNTPVRLLADLEALAIADGRSVTWLIFHVLERYVRQQQQDRHTR